MAVDYTTTALLASIRRRGMLPSPTTSPSDTLDDTDLLDLATEELRSYIVPLLLEMGGEALVDYRDISVVGGTARYALPDVAFANLIRDVQIQNGDVFFPLSQVEPERAATYAFMPGDPGGFMLEGNTVVLLPTPTQGGTLRVKFYRRPSALVLASTCALISGYNVNTATVTVANLPSWLDIGVNVDVVANAPPFDLLWLDLNSHKQLEIYDNPAGNQYTIGTTDALIGKIDVSLPDTYLCQAGETCVPQCPLDLWPLLILRTAQVALESLGDPRAKDLEARCERTKAQLLEALTPRARGTGQVLINRYGPGARFGRGIFRR